MPDRSRDEQINVLCQLAERGGSRRLLSRDGALLCFGSSKEAHERRMVVGVMVASLFAAMTVPLLFLHGDGWLTLALGVVACVMIALVVVPLVGRPTEVTLDLDENLFTVRRGDRVASRVPVANVRVFFQKAARGEDDSRPGASVSLRRSGDRSAPAIVLADELEVAAAREIRDLLIALLQTPEPS